VGLQSPNFQAKPASQRRADVLWVKNYAFDCADFIVSSVSTFSVAVHWEAKP